MFTCKIRDSGFVLLLLIDIKLKVRSDEYRHFICGYTSLSLPPSPPITKFFSLNYRYLF